VNFAPFPSPPFHIRPESPLFGGFSGPLFLRLLFFVDILARFFFPGFYVPYHRFLISFFLMQEPLRTPLRSVGPSFCRTPAATLSSCTLKHEYAFPLPLEFVSPPSSSPRSTGTFSHWNVIEGLVSVTWILPFRARSQDFLILYLLTSLFLAILVFFGIYLPSLGFSNSFSVIGDAFCFRAFRLDSLSFFPYLFASSLLHAGSYSAVRDPFFARLLFVSCPLSRPFFALPPHPILPLGLFRPQGPFK